MSTVVVERPGERVVDVWDESIWTYKGWILRLTRTRIVLLSLAVVGGIAILYRLAFGLGAATNLTNDWPWGMWVWWDVMVGVALAGGGYSTALLVNFIGKEEWKPIERAAFLTSLIGYLLVCVGLFLDLGRWINVVKVPMVWKLNPHSVMFELFFCVAGYTIVQIVEFGHIYIERVNMPKLARVLHRIYAPVLIVGVLLPCLHQSALGSLYVIAAGRLDPLWWTMVLPLFFLTSSFFIGASMITVENSMSAKAHHREAPWRILGQMAKLAGTIMAVYLVVKIVDVVWRGQFGRLFDGSTQSNLWLVEVLFGVAIPVVIYLTPALRANRRWLVTGATLAVLGIALNRANVVFTGMMAQADGATYLPSFGEIAVTVGIVAAGILLYAVVVDNFPILGEEEGAEPAHPESPAGADEVGRSKPLVVHDPWTKQTVAAGGGATTE
jgi:Ni/Fe-hydrogenase subunit HybB-like protein